MCRSCLLRDISHLLTQFVLFPGKVSWQLIRKAEIQISPSLRQIQTKGASYDMKRSFRSQLEMLTIFFKTRGGDKQRHLRISGTSATFKLTNSKILCIILSLSIDKHQTSSTLNTKLNRLVSLREQTTNSNCITNMTETVMIMLCLSPALSDLSTLTLTHISSNQSSRSCTWNLFQKSLLQ